MTQARSPERKVPTRRMDFEESFRDVSQHFTVDGDLISSHLVASLSAVFPDGEEFFVRSVRRFRDQVTDPTLKKQVAGFNGQEAVRPGAPGVQRPPGPSGLPHQAGGAHHRHLPAVSRAAPAAEVQPRPHRRPRARGLRRLPGRRRHRADTRQHHEGDPGPVHDEHDRLGHRLPLADRDTYKPGRLRSSWKSFKASPLVSREVWAQLKHYDRPDLHPDDRDTTALIERWREVLFGADGSLNDKLAGSAA